MSQAAADIRDLLSGRPGGVNRVIRRFGPHVIDYVGALLPDRSAPFERVVEDILVDILAQSRAAARSTNDDEVFQFGIECAFRTIRARHRELLDAGAVVEKATNTYTFDEVVERTKMSSEDLRSAISEGRIRAVRMNDQMRIKGDGIKGLEERQSRLLYHLTAAERELLCLHYRLGFTPEVIARWSGETPAHIEALIHAASEKLSLARAGKAGGKSVSEDTEIRRYIDGRLSSDETARFERRIIKDKIAQARLDEIRTQGQQLRELFVGTDVDLSSISVNVRGRNPHYAFSLPPVAALWLQMVALVALLLVMHRVGAYIAPARIEVSTLAGTIEAPASGRMYPGDAVRTSSESQALLQIDAANRLTVAPDSELFIAEPRQSARQVLRLTKGEIYGRFLAGGEAFVIGVDHRYPDKPARQSESLTAELTSDGGAEFDLVIGGPASAMLPDSLESERARLLATVLDDCAAGKLLPQYAEGVPGLQLSAPLQAGDRLLGIDGNDDGVSQDLLRRRILELAAGDNLKLTFMRGTQKIESSIRRATSPAWAVLRVFNGSIRLASAPMLAAKTDVWVSQGQWLLLTESLPPLVGLRGTEDFRALRVDNSDRFKQDVHWLRTDIFPLVDANSTLTLDRALRGLAERLEATRAAEIRRDSSREIQHFERWVEEMIAAAETRIAAGTPRERDARAGTLSDLELAGQKEVIRGLAQHWRRQASAGKYMTLGDAAKTLHRPIQNDRDQLNSLGTQLARADEMRKAMAILEKSIAEQDEAIANLVASEFHDPDGSLSAPLRARAAELELTIRDGAAARSRLDLLTLRLNELDERIDQQRRQLPALQTATSESTAALAAIDLAITKLEYTPAKLDQARTDLTAADKAVAAAKQNVTSATSADAAAKEAAADARRARDTAAEEATKREAAREAASSALTSTVSERAVAQKGADDAQAEVDRISAQLDALPADDPQRAELETQLAAARTAAADALSALEAARTRADAAKKALDEADSANKAAQVALAKANDSLSAADTAAKDADAALATAKLAQTKVETARKNADAYVTRLEAEKVQLADLSTQRITAADTAATAQAAEKACNDRIAVLEADAGPRRDELARELATIKAGEDAADHKREVDSEIGRYEGISRELAKRRTDRKVLVDDRDALASSDLVRNFEATRTETIALESRIVTHEYLRSFALAQDSIFHHEQQQALDRMREAELEAGEEAVAALLAYCPDYTTDAYANAFKGEAGAALKRALLMSLWRLYYNSGVSAAGVSAAAGSDSSDAVCYYVLRQSGMLGSVEKLQVLWRVYLGQALPEGSALGLSELKADDLTTRTR